MPPARPLPAKGMYLCQNMRYTLIISRLYEPKTYLFRWIENCERSKYL